MLANNMFDFEKKSDRERLESELSTQYDQAFKAGNFDQVLRTNARIENIWRKDDAQGYADPYLKEVIYNIYTDFLKQQEGPVRWN